MRFEHLKTIIEKYGNKAFVLYQHDYKVEVSFNGNIMIEFKWDQNGDIEKVRFVTEHGEYEGTTDEHIQYALDFIEANSEILINYKRIK